jgi:hypothetical protein
MDPEESLATTARYAALAEVAASTLSFTTLGEGANHNGMSLASLVFTNLWM